jgi:hypothetical protein
VAAAEGLKARCKQYVAEQVLEFENKEKMKKEEAEWGWSPTFRIMASLSLPGAPCRP